MRNFFCQSIPADGEAVELSTDESRHALSVLRVRVGDRAGLVDGAGVSAEVEITAVGGRREPVVCTVRQRHLHDPPTPAVHLHIAPSRTKGMSTIIRQATELGVASITPIVTERSVSKPDEKALGAWRAQAIEACKQSGNPFLAELHPPTPLADALSVTVPGYYGAVPTSNGDTVEGRAVHQSSLFNHQSIALFIGPEGGFTEDEVALLQRKLQPLTIGTWILRVETAVTACISVICAAAAGAIDTPRD
jgi:16S rRNA (uracil1498-N3)-methyltransferase